MYLIIIALYFTGAFNKDGEQFEALLKSTIINELHTLRGNANTSGRNEAGAVLNITV